ncbi:MAG: DUF3369 domain-containing protein [Desulfobacter sp.]|nr:MAG: DUF3369 domain-containing protein [Desulfobacter sp.]
MADMGLKSQKAVDGPLEFAGEDSQPCEESLRPEDIEGAWKILIVDDEKDVHDITRITLKGFTFEDREVAMISAYSGQEVKAIFDQEPDIAMVLLDVVMEEEDTGLKLVEYIREKMENKTVRIVLRTGQPGKAPEHAIISRYDINEYRTKPEFTAQRLFTSVTACLRAYKNLKAIERNQEGLEAIINSTALVFNQTSFRAFGSQVLAQLCRIFKCKEEAPFSSGFFIGMPTGKVLMIAGSGEFEGMDGTPIEAVLTTEALNEYVRISKTGGEVFVADTYIETFRTKEGVSSVLLLKNADRLSSEDRYLLRVYANNVSIGFDNITLAREIINTQKEVILILGEVVETRSQETAHHVTRVAEVCYLLAKKYGLDDDEAELLRLASPMHDVGKIGVPESILNKPGRLTRQEFEVMRDHARIGHEILNKSNRPIMKAAAITAYEHHEKWDGSGYPRGLKGEDIHIYGRIAAVADVFDALSHKRCYKEAWPVEKIVDTFKRDSGSHFDSKLVDLFLGHLDEFYEINRRFPE